MRKPFNAETPMGWIGGLLDGWIYGGKGKDQPPGEGESTAEGLKLIGPMPIHFRAVVLLTNSGKEAASFPRSSPAVAGGHQEERETAGKFIGRRPIHFGALILLTPDPAISGKGERR